MNVSTVQAHRGLLAEWEDTNPILAEGEVGVVLDAAIVKIGDGATRWNALRAFTPAAPVLPAVSGSYQIAGLMDAQGFVTLPSVADRLDLAPFSVLAPLTIDQIGLFVASGFTGTARLIVYTAGVDGWPDTPVINEQVTLSSNTFFGASVSYRFLPGLVYWAGIWTSGNPTFRAIGTASMRSFGLATGTATALMTKARRSVAYGATPPTPWSFVSTDISTSNVYAVYLRVA